MRHQLRAVDVANTVRLARTYYRSKSFLVVEGDDDRSVFARHTRGASCHVEVANGRDKVVETIQILDRDNFLGALGVVDSDYAVLEGEPPASGNLIYTDLHDLECMMLSSPALLHVLGELGDPPSIERFEAEHGPVRDYLLTLATIVGLARWASLKRAWALRFEGLDFAKFVREGSLAIDREGFVRELRNHQGNRAGSPPTADEIAEATEVLAGTKGDAWHVCCGHDLVQLLSIGLRRVLGKRNDAEVKPERLESMLRLAYERAYFESTDLFLKLTQWEQRQRPYAIF